jgi:putative membrane protein
MHPMFDDAARRELQAAARAAEAASAIEVVVTVRPRASSPLAADLVGGALLGYALLVFLLFAPPEFSLWVFAVAVPLGFAIGALGVHASPWAQRLLTRDRTLDAAVRTAAHAAFVELGIGGTRGRTGVLVFVAIAEARICVVTDTGIRAAVPALAWARAVRTVEAVPEHNGFGVAGITTLADAIVLLGRTAALHLPRVHEDVDELDAEIVIAG